MKSLAKKTVSAAYNKIGRINDLLNGPDPRFISYRENGKDKKIEKLDLNAENCHSYIGKMKIDGTGTYSDEVITALIKYFFDHTQKWEKVVIELANKVSELLNGKDSMKDHMNFEQQKQHMLDIAKSLDKKRIKDLEIVDIQDNNKRLFDVLKHNKIKWLDNKWTLPDFNKNFDSLDIARYLYSVAQQDPKYLAEIKWLKSDSFDAENKESDYYGLVEMAIRINALLHGITLQWWVARQKKYDALLLKHINPYIKDFPLLDEFKQNCRDYLKWETFKWLYFDTQESEKYLNKIDKEELLKSKTRNALLLTLGLTIGIWTTYFSSNYFDRKKQKAITEETIKDIFENRSVSAWWDMFGVEYKTPEEKLEQINYYKESIINDFVIRFGWYGKLTRQQFENIIIWCISDQKALNILADANSMDKFNIIIDNFLLLPQNKWILIHSWVDVTPYKRYQKYEEIFENTIDIDGYIQEKNLVSFKQVGGYVKLDWRWNAMGIAKTKNGKNVIVGWWYIYKWTIPKTENKDRSIHQWINISYDYFLQTKPMISTVIDEIILRYCWAEELNTFNSDFIRMKRKIKWNIKEKIIKYMVTNKLYEIDKDDFAKITEIADDFVLENKSILDKEFSLEAYGYFDQYKEAFANSLKIDSIEENFRNKNHPLRINEWDKSYKTKYIGKYRDKKWKIYWLLIVYIENKPYIFAGDFENPRRRWEYYISLWSEIAEEFLELRNK